MSDAIIRQFKQLSTVPSGKEAFEAWLDMADATAFLKDNVRSDEFVVYGATGFTYMHAVLVPRSAMNPPDIGDLLSWNFNPFSSWGVWTTMGDSPSVSISSPLGDERSQSFRHGEQLVFGRFFVGRLGNPNYYEILQKFVHVSGLHFIPERRAYCRLDENGDLDDVVRIIELSGKGGDSDTKIITFKRSVLDEYAALTDSVIVRTFDFTRFRTSQFSGWSHANPKQINDEDLVYQLHVQPGNASYMRGIQMVGPLVSKESVARKFALGDDTAKEYASFITYDWRHRRVSEISCSPDATANYFSKSDLPFELSPAFFRPDVLLRYKADSEKYKVEDRSITCRGAWELRSCDINEEGQVHAYLCDLRRLPYVEQLHWRAYNEAPKGTISKRAFTADFKGSWESDYDPLPSLKQKLEEWDRSSTPWWTLRSENLGTRVNYPVTTSVDEWAEELLRLDQFVVEGFEKQWLKERAITFGRTPDAQFGSLKLIEENFRGRAFEDSHVAEIVGPLQELHLMRSKLKGHASGEEGVKIKQSVIREHGSYKAHFRHLCGGLVKALGTIEAEFKSYANKEKP